VTKFTRLADVVEQVSADGLDPDALALIVSEALGEDLGGRGVLPPGTGAGFDVTSFATIPAEDVARGDFVARQTGTVAGLSVAAYAVAVVCEPAGEFEIMLHTSDGAAVQVGEVLATVTGNARALLTAERVALNLLTLMSGVATATAAWVSALAGTKTRVRDTRKTVPGLRMLQKYAVRMAGGVNHRMCLADGALIKDNHVIAAGGVVPAYQAVRAAFPDIGVQVEVTTLEQAREVVAAGATEILLDNMDAEQMGAAVAQLGSSGVAFEASGGLRLSDATLVAGTGVDYVAVGAITHSTQTLDIALDLST
jgi:nicotinate-nucleotide pyrophosphorylase (carboxylating)